MMNRHEWFSFSSLFQNLKFFRTFQAKSIGQTLNRFRIFKWGAKRVKCDLEGKCSSRIRSLTCIENLIFLQIESVNISLNKERINPMSYGLHFVNYFWETVRADYLSWSWICADYSCIFINSRWKHFDRSSMKQYPSLFVQKLVILCVMNYSFHYMNRLPFWL